MLKPISIVLSSLFVAPMLAGACAPLEDLGGSPGDGGTNADGQTTGNNAGASAAAISSSFSAAAVQRAETQCASGLQPPAATPSPTTIEAYRQQLVGAWWSCGGGAVVPNGGPVVITDDGRWITLVSDGNGDLIVGTTAPDNATYEIQTVFEGQTVDGPPGQLLGQQTTVVVTSAGGAETTIGIDPRQGELWASDIADAGDQGAVFVQL